MSRIRSKDTKVELALARALRRAGIHYRRHPKELGTPDFLVFCGGKKALVFVDGDFWHGWDYKIRKSRLSRYWREKIERNIERDKKQRKQLRRQGWIVIRVWEHDFKTKRDPAKKVIRGLLKR